MADDRGMKTVGSDVMTIGSRISSGTRDLTIATDLGVPRATAHDWDVASLSKVELRQEILKLRQRVDILAALLRLALAQLHTSVPALRCTSAGGRSQAVYPARRESAGERIPARVVLWFLHLSPSRFQVWSRRHTVCALD